MKKFIALALSCLLLVSSFALAVNPAPASAALIRQNNYPIIFVHGLAGFDDLLGIPYWGGSYNILKDLQSRGYTCYAAAVGPFSSNWDRACELYAQIVGGRVDYGKAHSEKYGHARYGRTYPGLYPDWGKVDPATGKVKKIHLVGHSMGGMTIRMLAQLLAEGSAEERAVTPASELSPLFAGGHSGWIDGILTVSTPHDGSTADYALTGKGDQSLLQWFLTFLNALIGAFPKLQNVIYDVYDMHLEQWGFTRQPGESFRDYIARIEKSTIWKGSKDLAAWDLKPEGAMELSQFAKAQPDIYYFSVTGGCTYPDSKTGYHKPYTLYMNPFMWYTASYIGKYTQTSPVPIDSSWWENDGLVSVVTASGPHLGSTDQIVNYTGTPQKGKWNYLGKVEKTDHLVIIGLFSLKDPRPLYRSWIDILGSLPE